MPEVLIRRSDINILTLDAELRGLLGDLCTGVSFFDGEVRVHLTSTDGVDISQVKALVQAHDPARLTARQIEDADADDARDLLREQITARLQWHQANPVTAQNAVQVLTRMQVEWVHFLKLLRQQVR